MDGVIEDLKEAIRQLLEKPKNNKSKLPQAYAKRLKSMPFPRFAAVTPLAMGIRRHGASSPGPRAGDATYSKFNNPLTALTFFVIIC